MTCRTLPEQMPGQVSERVTSARIAASSELPTRFGHFQIHVFADARGAEHVAMVRGEVFSAENVLTRVHSECFTGDVMGSLRCDCREQLETALALVGAKDNGIVLYLRQEGRGIGLTNKIRAYSLQQNDGLDTVDANRALGFEDDECDYGIAVTMLRTLGVRSIELLTNNPDKVRQLRRRGIVVRRRLPHVSQPHEHNRSYLETKARRSGHLLSITASDSSGADE